MGAGHYLSANIGVVCDTSGIAVLDLGTRDGRGVAEFQRLCDQHGFDGATPTDITAGGRIRLFFRVPAEGRRESNLLGPGGYHFDMQVKGLTAVPPFLHAYRSAPDPHVWAPEHTPLDQRLAPLPDFLLSLMTGEASGGTSLAPGGRAEAPLVGGELVPPSPRERDREVAALIGRCLRVHGVDGAWEHVVAGNQLSRAPMSEDTLARKFRSLAAKEDKKGERVRLPQALFSWAVPDGAKLYWAVRAYCHQKSRPVPGAEALAGSLCIRAESVAHNLRSWRRELEAAGRWETWETVPEESFFDAPTFLLRGRELQAKAGVRVTGLAVAKLLFPELQGEVSRKRIVGVRRIHPSTVSSHLKKLGGIDPECPRQSSFTVGSAYFDNEIGRRAHHNEYRLTPSVPLAEGW